MTLTPPSGPGPILTRIEHDGTHVVWARNAAGFLTCTTTPPAPDEATTTHLSATEKGPQR